MELEKQLNRKEQNSVIENTQDYVKKYCNNCRWNYFCCTLRVKLSFWDRMRIRLAGHTIRKVADHHPKHGWITKNEKGDCIFLKRIGGKASCSIYKQRPRDCRIFPHFYEKDSDCSNLVKDYRYQELDGTEFVEIRF